MEIFFIVLAIWIVPYQAEANETPYSERLRYIRIDDEVEIEDRPDMFEVLLKVLKTAKLVNMNTGGAEEAPKFGLAWSDLSVAASPSPSVRLKKPTAMEALETAAKMRNLRLYTLDHGIVLLPVSMPLRERKDVVKLRTAYTEFFLNLPIDLEICHTSKNNIKVIVFALNYRLQGYVGGEYLQKAVHIENRVLTPKKVKAKGRDNPLFNMRGYWSFNDFLYTYGVLCDLRISEELPEQLIVERVRQLPPVKRRR